MDPNGVYCFFFKGENGEEQKSSSLNSELGFSSYFFLEGIPNRWENDNHLQGEIHELPTLPSNSKFTPENRPKLLQKEAGSVCHRGFHELLGQKGVYQVELGDGFILEQRSVFLSSIPSSWVATHGFDERFKDPQLFIASILGTPGILQQMLSSLPTQKTWHHCHA